MALAMIVCSADPPDTSPALGNCVWSFENEAYYWYLFPLFVELKSETGKLIDLYDTVTFLGTELIALSDTLAAARRMVDAQPAAWDVHTGTLMREPSQAVFETVNKQRMSTLLDALESAVADALSRGFGIAFVGD